MDLERQRFHVGAEWVKYRLDLYHKFTLPSLLNQSFADFRIFVLCGNTHRAVTEGYKWHERVEPCYDLGRSRIAEIDTDFLALTRIDSDDLMHREAMAEVRDRISFIDDRECLVFRKPLEWEKINRVIRHPFTGMSPPFFTHVFPRRIYQDWATFSKLHHLRHQKAALGAKSLSSYKICTISHLHNISRDRKGIKPKPFPEAQRRELGNKSEGVIFDRDKIINILKDFGVKEEDVE